MFSFSASCELYMPWESQTVACVPQCNMPSRKQQHVFLELESAEQHPAVAECPLSVKTLPRHTSGSLVVAGTLKLHRVVAINKASTSTTTMKLDSQKTKECDGSSRQSHGFNTSHIAYQIKDSCGQKKRDIK